MQRKTAIGVSWAVWILTFSIPGILLFEFEFEPLGILLMVLTGVFSRWVYTNLIRTFLNQLCIQMREAFQRKK